MNQRTLSSLSPVVCTVLDPMLLDALLEVDLEPVHPPVVEAAPVPEVEPAPVEAKVAVTEELLALLRAHVRAATRHTALGHEAPSFRECSRPACRDAVRLIAPLEGIEVGATQAELDAVLDRALAALEAGLPELPPIRIASAR